MSTPTPEGPVPARTRWMVVGILLAAFLAGALAGATFEHYCCGSVARAPAGPPDGLPGPFEVLGLDAAQRARAEVIVKRRSPELEAIMWRASEQIRPVVESIAAEIRPILTPEQNRRLDEMLAHPPPFLPGVPPGAGPPPFPRPPPPPGFFGAPPPPVP